MKKSIEEPLIDQQQVQVEKKEVEKEASKTVVQPVSVLGWRYGGVPGGVVVLVVVAVLSFAAGMHFGDRRPAGIDAALKSSHRAFGGPGGGFRRAGGFGTVTAVSASSISVQDARQNTTKTYAITRSTVITNNGASAAYGDIKTGDTVLVRPNSPSSSDAATIVINPAMGGYGNPAPNQSDSSGTNGASAI